VLSLLSSQNLTVTSTSPANPSNAGGDEQARYHFCGCLVEVGRFTPISSRAAATRRVLQHREYTKSKVQVLFARIVFHTGLPYVGIETVVCNGRVGSCPRGGQMETRWVGSKARNADGYKLWFSGVMKGKNGVGILVDRELRESVVEVRRVNDRLMSIKLVVGRSTLNVISAYALQTVLDEEIKRCF
uniref:Uncharacterized protein n=1 Tax=Nicotiana tabacum TaxID=4097 RepID=A0A1S4CD82_TOBAC